MGLFIALMPSSLSKGRRMFFPRAGEGRRNAAQAERNAKQAHSSVKRRPPAFPRSKVCSNKYFD
jgi:hypothetical protein